MALSTQQKETILHPDQQALLDKKTGKLLISSTKAAYSAEWTNDRLYFDEALLPDIVKELERSYNIKITIADAALNSVRFYGNFRRREQSIREIMDVLSSTDKMTYIIEGKNIVITLPEWDWMLNLWKLKRIWKATLKKHDFTLPDRNKKRSGSFPTPDLLLTFCLKSLSDFIDESLGKYK